MKEREEALVVFHFLTLLSTFAALLPVDVPLLVDLASLHQFLQQQQQRQRSQPQFWQQPLPQPLLLFFAPLFLPFLEASQRYL